MSKFKFTWGHGLVIFLGCFMVFILTLIVLIGREESMELVNDDHYGNAVIYQEIIDAAKNANSLAHKPEIVQQANGYLLQFFENAPEKGQIQLIRLNNSEQDVTLPLKLDEQKNQLIHAVKLVDGDYEASVRWTENNKDYYIKKTLHWKDPSS